MSDQTTESAGTTQPLAEQIDDQIKESKQFRKDLDRTLQRLKGAPRQCRERSLAITKVQEALMWLGMDLKALNDGKSCYPDGYNPDNAKVDPVADGLKM